jgi:hypothetical protein
MSAAAAAARAVSSLALELVAATSPSESINAIDTINLRMPLSLYHRRNFVSILEWRIGTWKKSRN